MSDKKILFVVEGKAEQENLRKSIINHIGLDVKECNIITYKTSIYELYDLITKEENLDISLQSILIKQKFIDVDANYQLDSTFSNVYLIFDFDPQYHKYNKDKIEFLASKFNDETEEGLLLINYPMFESLFDITDLSSVEFLNSKSKVCSSKEYKKTVKERTCVLDAKGNVYTYIKDKTLFERIAKIHKDKYLKILNNDKYDGIETKKLLDLQLDMLKDEEEFYILNSLAILYFDYN